MRLLVQSLDTGRFLVPSLDDGAPVWVPSLREAGGGVTDDAETALELARDWAEAGERVQVVDLDRLGTADDYAPAAAVALRGTSGVAAVAGVSDLPDGNHGDNDFFLPGGH